MAEDFLESLKTIISLRRNDTNTSQVCNDKRTQYDFYQFSLIPAVLITLSFTFTRQRQTIWRSLWNGRPGLIFPMDALTRSYRVSYACAYGATASLVYRIEFASQGREYAFRFHSDDQAVRSFVTILSMLIYGLVFFPLFTSLAVGSVYGYAVGALYAWMLAGMEVYKLFECPADTTERILLIFRDLPTLACLLCLSVVMPLRVLRAYRQGQYFGWREDCPLTDTLSDIRLSYPGHYVSRLIRKPTAHLPREKSMGRVADTLLSWYHRYVYKRKRGFCYPTQLFSTLFVAILVVYMMMFEYLVLFPDYFEAICDKTKQSIELGIRSLPNPDDPKYKFGLQVSWMILRFCIISKVMFILSILLATAFSVINVLHALSSYRANVSALYKGDHSHIPPASAKSNARHCFNSIRFAGYQVGYVIWGYTIQLFVLFLVSLVAAFLIALLMQGFTSWLISFLLWLWPYAVTFVLMILTQFLLSKFIFLQERGRYLALNNRGVYFNFTYFMFFYNIFLGVGSCLLRVLKGLVLGIFFLGRLDYSTLPRRFEFLDPGFEAYVGYMQMEAAHTHPVLIVFCRLLLLALKEKREEEEKASGLLDVASYLSATSVGSVDREELVSDDMPRASPFGRLSFDHLTTPTPDQEQRRRRVAARFKWHVAYTLLRNPDIGNLRKKMGRQTGLMEVNIPGHGQQADASLERVQGDESLLSL